MIRNWQRDYARNNNILSIVFVFSRFDFMDETSQ